MTYGLVMIIVLLLLNIPIYNFLFRFFFENEHDYNESIRHTFTPNIISLFRGEYWRDRFNTARLQFYILICIGVVVLEYIMLNKFIDIYFSLKYGREAFPYLRRYVFIGYEVRHNIIINIMFNLTRRTDQFSWFFLN